MPSDVIDMLKQDHHEVNGMFQRYDQGDGAGPASDPGKGSEHPAAAHGVMKPGSSPSP